MPVTMESPRRALRRSVEHRSRQAAAGAPTAAIATTATAAGGSHTTTTAAAAAAAAAREGRRDEAMERALKKKKADVLRRIEAGQKVQKMLWAEQEELEKELFNGRAREDERERGRIALESLRLSRLHDAETYEEELRVDLFVEEALEAEVIGQEFRMGLTTARWVSEWQAEEVQRRRKQHKAKYVSDTTDTRRRDAYALLYLESRLRGSVEEVEAAAFGVVCAEAAAAAAVEDERRAAHEAERRRLEARAEEAQKMLDPGSAQDQELYAAEKALKTVEEALEKRRRRQE